MPDNATAAQDLGSAARVRSTSAKAWREMIHRYLAGGAGAGDRGAGGARRGQPPRSAAAVAPPLALVGAHRVPGAARHVDRDLLLKPLIVVLHLLGGLATLALLAWLAWRAHATSSAPTPGAARARRSPARRGAGAADLRSAAGPARNYAAPSRAPISRSARPVVAAIADFQDGFVLWRGLGIDYEGGVLDHPARVAIQFAHRLGAVVAALLIAALGVEPVAGRRARADGSRCSLVLALQLSLGIASSCSMSLPLRWPSRTTPSPRCCLFALSLNANAENSGRTPDALAHRTRWRDYYG